MSHLPGGIRPERVGGYHIPVPAEARLARPHPGTGTHRLSLLPQTGGPGSRRPRHLRQRSGGNTPSLRRKEMITTALRVIGAGVARTGTASLAPHELGAVDFIDIARKRYRCHRLNSR
jgi:hypothetical protein